MALNWWMLSERVRRVLVRRPLFGDVIPTRPNPPTPTTDARTAALRSLRDYLCDFTYWREGTVAGKPIPFQLDPKNFHIEWPDDVVESDLPDGTMSVIPGRFQFLPVGLNTYVQEDTLGRGCLPSGVALQVQHIYSEQLQLEYLCALMQQRHGLMAAATSAFAPAEMVAALRLRCPDYYGVGATFRIVDGQLADAADEGRRRRRTKIGLELRVPIVAAVRTRPLNVAARLDLDADIAIPTPPGYAPPAPEPLRPGAGWGSGSFGQDGWGG